MDPPIKNESTHLPTLIQNRILNKLNKAVDILHLTEIQNNSLVYLMWNLGWTAGGSKQFYRKQPSALRIIALRLGLVVVIILVVALIFWVFEKDNIKDEAGDDFSFVDSPRFYCFRSCGCSGGNY